MAKKMYPAGETREDRIVRAKTHHYHVRQRRVDSQQRQAACAALTPLERLALLDYKLGFNVGATRERYRLNQMIGD